MALPTEGPASRDSRGGVVFPPGPSLAATMISVRQADAGDIPTIAGHRAAMFAAMGVLPATSTAELVDRTTHYLRHAIPAGEYLGWLAAVSGEPRTIVGGAGVQLRRVLPFPQQQPAGPAVALGRQGLVMNVYTEPSWRRRGVARQLLESILSWAREVELESLVLHASGDGRALYEQLGFTPTNEMRLIGRPSIDSA